MGFPPIKVITAGLIDLTPGKEPGLYFRLRNWSFDMGQREGEPQLWRDDIVVAVRDFITKQCETILSERTKSQPKEAPILPISLSIEREAEMETFLLINRCQGNG